MGKTRHPNCTVGNPNSLMRNGEGYVDKTAYEALVNIHEPTEAEVERVSKLIKLIRGICDMIGFRIEGRIVLVDKVTERVWR